MFYTRAEQMQRTGYWCALACLPTSPEIFMTPVLSPYERRRRSLLGLTCLRLHTHQNPGFRTLAMVIHYHRCPDPHHFDTFLVLLPRLPNQCLVLDPRGTGQGRGSHSGQSSRCGKQDVQEGTVRPPCCAFSVTVLTKPRGGPGSSKLSRILRPGFSPSLLPARK